MFVNTVISKQANLYKLSRGSKKNLIVRSTFDTFGWL